MPAIVNFQGLNERGQKLIAGCGHQHYAGKRIYPVVANGNSCETISEIGIPVLQDCVEKTESGNVWCGIYPEKLPLYQHTLRDKTTYIESVQTTLWSKTPQEGPVIFLALKNEDDTWVQESLWTKEEIETIVPEEKD